jgi:hypothetical protein
MVTLPSGFCKALFDVMAATSACELPILMTNTLV